MRIQVVRSAEVSFISAETALVVPVFSHAFPVECEALAEADAAVEQAERDLATRQARRVAAREAVKRAQRQVEELSFGR